MTISQHEPLAMVVSGALEFLDAGGELWQVTEHDCWQVPGARSALCLIFMSEAVFRRVWVYPAEWADPLSRRPRGAELAAIAGPDDVTRRRSCGRSAKMSGALTPVPGRGMIDASPPTSSGYAAA